MSIWVCTFFLTYGNAALKAIFGILPQFSEAPNAKWDRSLIINCCCGSNYSWLFFKDDFSSLDFSVSNNKTEKRIKSMKLLVTRYEGMINKCQGNGVMKKYSLHLKWSRNRKLLWTHLKLVKQLPHLAFSVRIWFSICKNTLEVNNWKK